LPDLVCAIEGVTEEIGFLHFAMTEKIIVTGRLRGGYKIVTRAALLEAIMGYMIDSIDRLADDVAAKLDHIEEQILADEMGEGR
jgi:zinc transporter